MKEEKLTKEDMENQKYTNRILRKLTKEEKEEQVNFIIHPVLNKEDVELLAKDADKGNTLSMLKLIMVNQLILNNKLNKIIEGGDKNVNG